MLKKLFKFCKIFVWAYNVGRKLAGKRGGKQRDDGRDKESKKSDKAQEPGHWHVRADGSMHWQTPKV
jgi:hypothetical protein